MTAFRVALSFLTVLPVGPRALPQDLSPSRAFFPLVGLMLGGVLVGADALLAPALPPLAVGALLVAALLAITRALHVEGFMDVCDGLFGGYTRERRLEIMKDPHVGSFAVAGGVTLLMLKWALVATLVGPARLPALALFPCLSRWGMLLATAAHPYARQEGMGRAFRRGRGAWQVAAGFATALVAAAALGGVGGIALWGVATAVAWTAGWWMARLLGGLTGCGQTLWRFPRSSESEDQRSVTGSQTPRRSERGPEKEPHNVAGRARHHQPRECDVRRSGVR